MIDIHGRSFKNEFYHHLPTVLKQGRCLTSIWIPNKEIRPLITALGILHPQHKPLLLTSFLWLSMSPGQFQWRHSQNGHQIPSKSRGSSSVNKLLPSRAIWRQRSGLTLAQVMACYLTTPSHYLGQCWLITSDTLWHSPECYFTGNAKDN